jgi:hypothetical protein
MSKLTDWLIKCLGGYTEREWDRRIYAEDKKLDAALAKKDEVIMELALLRDNTPGDCKRGEWCSQCVYAKRKVVYTGSYPGESQHVAYYCGKEGACKNLTFREDPLYA